MFAPACQAASGRAPPSSSPAAAAETPARPAAAEAGLEEVRAIFRDLNVPHEALPTTVPKGKKSYTLHSQCGARIEAQGFIGSGWHVVQ